MSIDTLIIWSGNEDRWFLLCETLNIVGKSERDGRTDNTEHRMRIEVALEPQWLLRTDGVNRVSQNYCLHLYYTTIRLDGIFS